GPGSAVAADAIDERSNMDREGTRVVIAVVPGEPPGGPRLRLFFAFDLLQCGRLAMARRALQQDDSPALIVENAIEDALATNGPRIDRRREELVRTRLGKPVGIRLGGWTGRMCFGRVGHRYEDIPSRFRG